MDTVILPRRTPHTQAETAEPAPRTFRSALAAIGRGKHPTSAKVIIAMTFSIFNSATKVEAFREPYSGDSLSQEEGVDPPPTFVLNILWQIF